MQAEGNHIKGLDGLRALAVSFVILSHLHVTEYVAKTGYLGSNISKIISASVGVEIFLILSGYLITTLLIRENNQYGTISIRNFYARRGLRIFPLYFLFSFLCIAMEMVGKAGIPDKSFIYLLTFTYNFVPRSEYAAILGHTWSLAVEEHFYLIWPATFLALFSPRRPILLFVTLSAVIAMWWAAYPLSRSSLSAGFFINRWTMVAGAPIALGCVMSLLLHAGSNREFWHRIIRSRITLALGVAFFLNVVVANIWLGGQLRAIGTMLVIGWIALNQGSLLTEALELRPIAYVGRISYGLYIWQGFFLSSGASRFQGQTWPPDQMTGFILLCLVAPLSWHGFEKPILRLRSRFRGHRPPAEGGSIACNRPHATST